ncbi:T9SS type B sorting domain-containing protein, partial [Flavobacterium sp.]|uniref:Ig-like domain-containing protein n=1 Tax=Flavobacterium sp. TaxID=239 RepID=UPI0037BE8619
AMYIQISSGYDFGQDVLTLTGIHPAITSSWNATEGKLTLIGISGEPTYLQFEAAIESVVFTNSDTNPSGQRIFSITIGQANYLESTGHYYEYIPNTGISWINAKNIAATSTYYGLQGYLATITNVEEVQISGIQASGAGWIGGSDEVDEGVWKWVSGPELGVTFWNGSVSGSSPNFSFWNTGEPNNSNNEDYAHVTAPGVGQPGSWNDLTNIGESSGDYQPKGYIVEYGGMPGDPILQISTTSIITMPIISNTTNASRCGSGSVLLQATTNTGSSNWYTSPTGGAPIFTGNSFNTPILNVTTDYYVDVFPVGCTFGNRVQVTATIKEVPIISFIVPNPVCQGTNITIQANTTIGTINWYDSNTSLIPIFTGTSFTTPNLNTSITYYIEAESNGCTSNRLAIPVQVVPAPTVVDETVIFCENTSVTLQSGISGGTYLWSTGAITQDCAVASAGTYSVIVTTPQNCNLTKNFTVIENITPEITFIKVEGLTAEIGVNGTGIFEYSLDNIIFQNSNIFNFTVGGEYTCYVREIGTNCGFDYRNFVVIDYPKFFTPNADGFNDYWKVNGMHLFPDANIAIFDRYGQLITVLNTKNPYWDGKLNGENVSSSDYWFVANLGNNISEVKGHFSLKR